MVGALCSHRSPRGDRKRLKEEYFPLFVLFVLFGQAKRTLKEKKHKETFPFIVLLCDGKVREKKNYIFNKNILKNFPVFITENNINNEI